MKKEAIEELTNQLKDGVLSLRNSQTYRDYLTFLGRLYHYSINNSILIYQQMPTTQWVGSYTFWKSQKRYVKKGEHGIRILAPLTCKEKQEVPLPEKPDQTKEKEITRLVGFRVATVFDVSQTDGEPLPEILQPLQGNSQPAKCLQLAIQKVADFPIVFKDCNGNGYFDHEKIVIKPGLSTDQTAKTMLHEYVHSCFHDSINDYRENRALYENQAESTAFIVSQHFGLDTSAYSFGYVGSWIEHMGEEAFVKSLSTIKDLAVQIIENLDGPFQFQKERSEIKSMVQGSGLTATDHIIDQIQKLNQVTKKQNTLQDIKDFHSSSPDAQELAQSLRKQFKTQQLQAFAEPCL